MDAHTFVNGHSVLKPCWTPPRGWAGLAGSPHDIALVALNPGAPLGGEVEHYRELALSETNISITCAQAAALEAYCADQYLKPKRGSSWVFHRKSVALARALLWLMDGQDPQELDPSFLRRCWFTDVYKCSTRQESSPTITGAAFAACRPHLERELKIVKPKLIVALGIRAEKRLKMTGVDFVCFRHPSNGCPRLDAEYHDRSFAAAATRIGAKVPLDFRETRRKAYEDAMAM